jgi:hypothetical protein
LFGRAAFFGRSFLLVLSELEKTFKKRLKKHYKNVVIFKNIVIFVFKKHKKQIDMKTLIEYTNNRIANWYYNAKKDYGVIGHGKVRFTEDSVIVDYVENGKEKTWSMAFYPEYLKEQKIDWVFNCWMELA